jgi:hypothetical protein
MHRHHVAPSTFTDWSCLPPPSSSVLDSWASFGSPESLLSAQMPPKKVPKLDETDVQRPSTLSACPLSPTVNPFFSGFTESAIASQSSSSTSPSQSDFNVDQFFNGGDVVTKATTDTPKDDVVASAPAQASSHDVSMAAAATWQQQQQQLQLPNDDCVLECSTFICGGGTWSVDGGFEKCQKRPANQKVKHHSRGMVCTVHHDYVKCQSQSCRIHVHFGCYVLQATGVYIQACRGLEFTCQQCTLNSQAVVKSEGEPECTLGIQAPKVNSLTTSTYASLTAEPQPAASDSKKPTTVSMFDNKQHLMQYARDHGWKCRSSEATRIYFVCQKKKEHGGCSTGFGAKANGTSAGGDIENEEWRAVNMPEQHGCCKSVVKTALTTRVCHLPRDAFKEIQRLACCKAFHSNSIQTYIRLTYNIVVDTPLIYNIGYRARNKLGIGDYTLLLAQQAVRVYT